MGTPQKRPVNEHPVTGVQLLKVWITKHPDYQMSNHQRSRLPNVRITQFPVTKHPATWSN
jgi:hypothetical protein